MTAGESAAEQARRKRERAERLLRDAERWDRGADGERQVGRMLDQLPDRYVVFHDLQIPGSKANVDHLVLGPSGIWAIDTKNYQYPVTIGSGKGAGKLWTGRRPLADTMETTKWEADSVAELIGYTVDPVMCVIAPSLPKPKFEFAGLTVCAPSHLRQVFADADADGAVDVGAAELAVRYAFDASPAKKAAPFVSSPTPPPPPRPPTQTTLAKPERRSSIRPTRSKQARSAPSAKRGMPKELTALFKLVALVVGAIIAVPFLPTISTWVGQRASEAVMDDVLDTADGPVDRAAATTTASTTSAATTEPTIPVEAPEPVRYVVRCSPDGRWTISWGWPGDPPAGVAGYGIRTKAANGPELDHTIAVWAAADDKPAGIVVDPASAEFDVITDYRNGDGDVLASVSAPFRAPTISC